MAAPFFSVGVMTYRRPALLAVALRSVLEQGFADFEVIVGNDDPDGPLTAADLGLDDPRLEIVNHARNLKPWNNMNFMLHRARGRYFVWLADDDMFARDYLEAAHAALVAHDYPTAVFTAYFSGREFDGAAQGYTDRIEAMQGADFLRRFLARELRTVGCFSVYERDYLRGIGGIEKLGDGPYAPYNDHLLSVRAGRLPSLCFIHAPLIFFRIHPGSFSYYSDSVETYRTAQRDFIAKSLEVMDDPALRADRERNLYQLLRWCLDDFFVIVSRAGAAGWAGLGAYHRLLAEHARGLQPARRVGLAFWALAHLVKAALNTVRYALRAARGARAER